MSTHELPSLPEVIVDEMQALRHLQPPAELVERAMAQLPAVKSSEHSPPSSSKTKTTRHSRFVFVIPTAVIAAAAMFLAIGHFRNSSGKDIVRIEERRLELPESGHVWTALDLQTQHHADQPAVVHLEVPHDVRVRLPADGEPGEQHCAQARCIHRFTQHHGKGVPLRIAVTHPGRYEIHVRHESKKAAMREHFVVTANR